MLGENSSLGKVIECLQEQEQSGVHRPEGKDIQHLHNVTIGLLDKFSDHIDRCKKYNEARIHRKYQNTISMLEQQNLALRRALQLQREAVPKSRAYVSDLIDRMVQLRAENDALRKLNQNLQQELAISQNKHQSIPKRRDTESQISNQSQIIRDAIGKFLRSKKEEDSKLGRFLEFNSTKAGKWTLYDLLLRLDKWSGNLRDVRFVDSQRVRQHLHRTCSSAQDTLPPTAIRTTVQSTQGASSLIRLRTENMGTFVNDRLTLVNRRRNGKGFLTSSLRRQSKR